MTADTRIEAAHWDTGIGALRVTGFAEASAVLRGDGWSSEPRRNPLVNDEIKNMPGGSLIGADPPEHNRMRRLVAPAFTPKAVDPLRPRVAAIVESVLDGLAEVGPKVDVLADIAYPVALSVITELFDIGVAGAELFAELTPKLARGIEFDATPDEVMDSALASTEMTVFLTPILSERRRRPGGDFISALLALDNGTPEGLTLGEVLSMCILLLIAGHETTANLVANSALALLQAPEQIPKLLADPPRAVEELLRLHGPVKLVTRTALTDQVVAGHRIRRGEAVLVDLRAANRDPNRFGGAERMDLARDPGGQLALGAGIHFCLGAALARLETAETLTGLFIRYPALRLTGGQMSWRESLMLHALHSLPVELSADRARPRNWSTPAVVRGS